MCLRFTALESLRALSGPGCGVVRNLCRHYVAQTLCIGADIDADIGGDVEAFQPLSFLYQNLGAYPAGIHGNGS